MDDNAPRLGFCCKWVAPDADAQALRAMNQVGVTVASLTRREPAAAVQRLLAAVGHNLEALERQLRWVAARPPGERLLRIISSLLPAYTHPATRAFYREPAMRELIEHGLVRCGELAREGGVRLSMHPGQFCVLATASEQASPTASTRSSITST